MRISRARPEDAGILSGIAFAAKGHWGYPERWMEQWREALTITPDFIRDNETHTAVVDGVLVGFYALVGEGRKFELENLWVLPDYMGSGVGRALFEHAMNRAASLGAASVEIESDPNAEGFYRRMGAKRAGENVYDLEGRERVLPTLVVDVPASGSPVS